MLSTSRPMKNVFSEICSSIVCGEYIISLEPVGRIGLPSLVYETRIIPLYYTGKFGGRTQNRTGVSSFAERRFTTQPCGQNFYPARILQNTTAAPAMNPRMNPAINQPKYFIEFPRTCTTDQLCKALPLEEPSQLRDALLRGSKSYHHEEQ